ncbi:MAG: hypothetical protein C5B47_04310 [Verrucomicrobia bacterium]|nr:MAG: hypothetical protein C5B47_04310 [Verrucomicrobiota bacterium]
MTRFLRDFSFSAIFSGFLSVVIGFSASGVIIYQAARSVGASDAETASWLWALGVGGGIFSMILSFYYRIPLTVVWSTPGAAMLITGASGLPLNDAIGAFLVCGLLILVSGFTGWFERALAHIPMALASGMLAGVMLRFGLDVFNTMQYHFTLVATMLGVWLLTRCWSVRYAMLLSLAAGIILQHNNVHFQNLRFALTQPVFIEPHFSLAAAIGVGVPLFVVTMASQNIPGVAVLRADGYYNVPISPMVGWSGVLNVILAPFGAFAFCLTAITAAICTGREAHDDPQRRYIAGMSAGFFYMIIGLFGSVLTDILNALPKELVLTTAGIALFGAIGNGLATAMLTQNDREAALMTFLVTASGMTLLGVGSSFWGLVVGVIVLCLCRIRHRLAA